MMLRTWNKYFVNGYKFHTRSWSNNKKIMNSGIWVEGSYENEGSDDYYGYFDEIIEMEYSGTAHMRLIIFKCEWFDPTPQRGTRVGDEECKIVEVRRNGRYHNYDPFIIAQMARQVYYVSYPGRVRSKSQWLAVIKTKARCRVEVEEQLEVAYQNDDGAQTSTVLPDLSTVDLNDADAVELIDNVEIDENVVQYENNELPLESEEEDISDATNDTDVQDEDVVYADHSE